MGNAKKINTFKIWQSCQIFVNLILWNWRKKGLNKMGIFKEWNKTENRNIYCIDYYDENGKRKRESTGSGSYSFAKELLLNRKDEVAQRKKLPERYIPKIKFSDFVDNEYLAIHAKG